MLKHGTFLWTMTANTTISPIPRHGGVEEGVQEGQGLPEEAAGGREGGAGWLGRVLMGERQLLTS